MDVWEGPPHLDRLGSGREGRVHARTSHISSAAPPAVRRWRRRAARCAIIACYPRNACSKAMDSLSVSDLPTEHCRPMPARSERLSEAARDGTTREARSDGMSG